MSERTDLYANYTHFAHPVLDLVRKETFGEDIGQNSWLTADEHDRFLAWLELASEHHVLEVASGSGAPALRLVRKLGCRLTGVDANENAVATATRLADAAGLSATASFQVADANSRLPFEADAFDGVLCVDAMNHLLDRLSVLREWHRVLRPGRRAVFTDPVVITGPVTNAELALRSSIGLFLFVPPGVNERFIQEAGLGLVHQQDASDNAASISGRWHRARQVHRKELLELEGVEQFEGVQRFLETVEQLTGQRSLSRIAYVVEKPAR